MTEDIRSNTRNKEIPVEFWKDEVRCEFVVPATIKQAWAAELEVLKEIDRVCRKHHITYYADWGTLLGAVRHGGFVPWDDDLDIVMKRADYERFLRIAVPDMEEGYAVQTYRNQKDFWLFMGKVVGRNHFCFEKEHLRRFHNFPYIACVDIFVLDYVYKDPEKEEKRKNICKYMLGIADGIVDGTIQDRDKEWHLHRLEQMSGQKYEHVTDPVEMGRYLYGEVEKCFAQVPEQEADYLVQMFPWGLKDQVHYYSKEYYGDPVYLPFEYTMIPVPPRYDQMLRERYGDYLKLVKDAGAHDYPFFEGQKRNLQKVLDFPLPEFRIDKSRLRRSEEELETKQRSYKAMGEECLQELRSLENQIEKAVSHPSGGETEIAETISDSQQLAIDFGTMLEQVGLEDYGFIGLLKQYCEELYQLYQLCGEENGAELDIGIDTEKEKKRIASEKTARLSELIRGLEQEWDKNYRSKKMILFMISHQSEWENIRSLWKEKTKDSRSVSYLAVLPYYIKDYDGSPMKWCDEEIIDVDVNENQILNVKEWTAEYLELLHPKEIVIQNPYDEWNPVISIPPMFYTQNIRKFTDELIYVSPYRNGEFQGEGSREYRNMQYYVTMPGVVYADRVYVWSDGERQRYVEKLSEFAGEDTKMVWESKISVFNVSDETECADQQTQHFPMNKKKLLYGISIGTYLEDPEAAERKIRDNLRIFQDYKDKVEVMVSIFPEHPNEMWDNVKKELKGLLEENEIGCIDSEEKIDSYDAYYGDPMPAVMKFYEQKKPVMIENMQCLSEEHK